MRELHKVETDQAVSLLLTTWETYLNSPQIKDAIERLVSLIQGEEGHDTKAEHIGELVKVKDEEAELDVVEV